MTRTHVGALLLAGLLAGCGSVSTTASRSPSTSPAAAAPSTSPAAGSAATSSSPDPAPVRALAVTYVRTGGFTGTEESVQITRGKPSDGYDKAQIQRILDTASNPALRTLQLPALPRDPCCDLFVYTLRISWSDGTSRILRTADGQRQPPQLRRLLSQLA